MDLFVLGAAIVITISGLWINITKRARKSEKKPDNQEDRHSLILFRWLVPMALVGSLIMFFRRGPWLLDSIWVFAIGLILLLFGLGVRWYAVWQLGQAFTVQLQVTDQQKLTTKGIFRHLRHPSYAGLLLYYIGLGLMMGNLLCLTILIVLPLWAVLNRITLEEKLLLSHFGEAYQSYQAQSWRLLPWVY